MKRAFLAACCRIPLLSLTVIAMSLSADLCSPAFSEDTLPELQQSLRDSSIVLLKIDTSQLAVPEAIQKMETSPGDSLGHLLRLTEKNVRAIQDITKGEALFLSLDLPSTSRFTLHATASKSVPVANLERLSKYFAPDMAVTDRSTTTRSCIDIGLSSTHSASQDDMQISKDVMAQWNSAMLVTREYPMQCVVLLPHYLRKTLEELKPDLPDALGGGSSDWLLKGASWISIGVDTKKANSRIVVQSDSAESAKVFKEKLPKLLRALVEKTVRDKKTALALSMIAGMIKPEQSGDQVVISLNNEESSQSALQLSAMVIGSALTPWSSSSTSNKLKQFGLAFHNYQDAFQSFPTYKEMVKSNKKSGLSWRVHILPFIEQQALYQEFHLDEAWDSPHNIQLLPKMPEIYRPVPDLTDASEVKPYHTTYVAPIGEKTVFGQSKPVSFRHISDGTSNTIAFVELKKEHAIPWTSPEEYPFDPSNPTAKLRDYSRSTNVALFDGSVMNVSLDLPTASWLGLFSFNGGEVVSLD